MSMNSLCDKCKEKIKHKAFNDPEQLIDSKLVIRLARVKKEIDDIIFIVERELGRRLFR